MRTNHGNHKKMSDHTLMEVYFFRGHGGERVPKTVNKLFASPGVEVLPDLLCGDCEHLRGVAFPIGLTEIGNHCFINCTSLLDINICGTVKTIGMRAFQNCNRLKKAEFEFSSSSPHQLTAIQVAAFLRCTSLKTLKLPASLRFIDQYVFYECYCLIEANLSATSLIEVSG